MPYVGFIFLLLLGYVLLPAVGIIPRELIGLTGIPISVFKHADPVHFWSNFIPLILMSGWLFYRHQHAYIKLMCWLILGSGALTWLIGETNHVIIGASSLVCALFAFIITRGFIATSMQEAVIGLSTMLLYGSLIIGGLIDYNDFVSVRAHLAGIITGLLIGFLLIDSTISEDKSHENGNE